MKKKILLWILSICLVIIAGSAGTIYYFLKVKTYDVADTEVTEITQSEYEIELPPADAGPLSEPAAEETSATGTETTVGNEATTASKGTSTPKANTTKSPSQPEVTVASIKDKYRPIFQSLEAQANEKVNSLVGRAFNEYKENKNKGQSISFAYFYQKYSTAGKQLEGKTDEAFNYIYTALQAELKKHGYSSSHAKDFKEQYEKAKRDREAALLTKAKDAL